MNKEKWHNNLKPRFQNLIENPDFSESLAFCKIMISTGEAITRHNCHKCNSYVKHLENILNMVEEQGGNNGINPIVKQIVAKPFHYVQDISAHLKEKHNYVNPYKNRLPAIFIAMIFITVAFFSFNKQGIGSSIALSICMYRVCSHHDRQNMKKGVTWVW
jgi:hypothetical protein